MDSIISDSDWESYSESSCSEEQEELDFLYNNAVSLLSGLDETIGKIDDFLSFERGFTYGEVVSSVENQSGQMGKVMNINMFVDLENASGRIIKDVNSKKLFKIRPISVGDIVVHETWVGRVDKVIDRVFIVFDDGSGCEVSADEVLPVSPSSFEDFNYPGQRVQFITSNASGPARWLCGAWRENQDEGTISRVEAGFVYVDWFASARIYCGLSAPPPRLQDARNLILLSCFPHANWQLGDWCIYHASDNRGNMEEVVPHVPTHNLHKDETELGGEFKGRNTDSKLDDVFTIVKTRTKIDVLWQDGSSSVELDSQNLLPVNVVNAHEYWPEQFVLEKGACDNSQRWGVVRGMDAKERTVRVQWKNMVVSGENGFHGEQIEETVSAYELVEHPEYSYSVGDIVFRNCGNYFCNQSGKGQATSKGKNSNEDQHEYPTATYLSYIGIVTGFQGGNLEVKWASGLLAEIAPNEICQMEKFEGATTNEVLYEETTEEYNKEMVTPTKQSCSQMGKDSLNHKGADENGKRFSWLTTSVSQAAVGFFTSITCSLLGSPSSSSSSVRISDDGKGCEILPENNAMDRCHDSAGSHLSELQIYSESTVKQEVEDDEIRGTMPSRAVQKLDQFKQFDMVNDCSDHHFLNENKVLGINQVKRNWLKKIQQEWSILEKDLPETIYVRAYEERMDLLRAALVGAPGTPYHDGLFFFDIFLPPSYPYEPPMVHYSSGGLRLNPNLYESGKVCLSLLNTWTGSGNEVWNPGSSTILQVLLSLQALVLNEKPYFNEAGYDKQVGRVEGEKNSISYNEDAFLGSCKMMLHHLRKPPKHFEALVKEHFSKRSQFILLACQAYMEGAPVGHAFDSNIDKHENFGVSSTGFKIMLAKLFPKLVDAFSDMGIDCTLSAVSRT